jgi:hypothetical protein
MAQETIAGLRSYVTKVSTTELGAAYGRGNYSRLCVTKMAQESMTG